VKVGDLVYRKHGWHDRWGVVVEAANPRSDGKMQMLRIYWFVDTCYNGWFGAHKLEAVKKCP